MAVVAADRDHPDHYWELLEFASSRTPTAPWSSRRPGRHSSAGRACSKAIRCSRPHGDAAVRWSNQPGGGRGLSCDTGCRVAFRLASAGSGRFTTSGLPDPGRRRIHTYGSRSRARGLRGVPVARWTVQGSRWRQTHPVTLGSPRGLGRSSPAVARTLRFSEQNRHALERDRRARDSGKKTHS